MTLGEALLRSLPDHHSLRRGTWDPALIDDPPPSADERLRRMLAILAGRRDWNVLCEEQISTNDLLSAIAVQISARGCGVELCEELCTSLASRWSELAGATRDRVAGLRTRLQAVSREATDAVELAADALQELSLCELPPGMPLGMTELETARRAVGRLSTMESYVDEILAESRRQLDQMRRRHRSAAHAALDRLIAEIDGGTVDDAVARAVSAFPELVTRRVTHMLESIGGGSMRDPLVQSMLVQHAHGSDHRHGGWAVPVRDGEAQLSTASLKRLENAALGGVVLDGPEAMLATAQQVRRVDEEGRARIWLAAARATSDAKFRQLAFGYGLAAEGRHVLAQRGSPRMGRIYLRDGLQCLLANRQAADPDEMQSAVVALWVVAATPRLFLREVAVSDALAEWTERPEQFFAFLEREEAWEIFAEAWSHESIDAVADVQLDMALEHLRDASLLLRACVRSLLGSAQLFRVSTANVLRRLGRLLSVEGVPGDAAQLLESIAGDLVIDAADGDASRRRAFIHTRLADLEVMLEPVSSRTSLSHQELLRILRERVGEVFDEHRVDEQPNLRTELLLDALYPHRRRMEIRIPIRVSNSERGALVRDLFVDLSLARGEQGASNAEFSEGGLRQEISIGTLNSGEGREVSVFIDIDPGAMDRVSEVKLTASLRVEERVLLRKELGLPLRPDAGTTLHNPFSAGKSVTGEHFIGRERETALLLDTLCGDNDRVPLVVGVRRIGKTSILHHIAAHPEVRRRYVPIYVSLEDRPKTDTTSALLGYICEQIWQRVPREQQARMTWSRQDFDVDPYVAFETFFQKLDTLSLQRRVLLVFDEFDRVIELVRLGDEAGGRGGPQDVVQRSIFAAIRKVIMTPRNVRMVFAGLPAILVAGYQDRLFGLFDPLKVLAFTEQEADRIIDAGRSALRFDPEARREIMWATGSQPYLLQLICQNLFARVLSGGRDVVTAQDVQEVIARDILSNESYFLDYRDLVDQASGPILRALATVLRELMRLSGRRYATLDEIAAQSARDGAPIEASELERILDQMVGDERPLVQVPARGRRVYRITIGLLGDDLLRRSEGRTST